MVDSKRADESTRAPDPQANRASANPTGVPFLHPSDSALFKPKMAPSISQAIYGRGERWPSRTVHVERPTWTHVWLER